MIIQSIRGMNDILPDKTSAWQYLEKFLRDAIQSYGYQEIRFPYLESTTLFKRAIGEATDIVEKEMYTFLDKNEESVTLRPEGTAGCVRACLQNHLLYHQTQKLWYLGPMFRYERPQKGRYRQFHQCGVEAYGFSDIDIEVEILLMTARFWRDLGLDHTITLEINTLGTIQERQKYRQILVDYFKKNHIHLDADSQKRLESNPLRILDSKNPDMQALIEEAPQLINHLEKESSVRFERLCQQLNKAVDARLLNQAFRINPRLVRGLDYYSHTVFEWITHDLGAQGTVCAGGRYDGLVAQLSGKEEATPAFGFGLGLERLLLLLENTPSFQQKIPSAVDIYCILLGESAEIDGRLWIEQWRSDMASYRIEVHCGGGNIKNQMKKADKSGASIALILGEEEMHSNTVSLKFLREDKPQLSQPQKDIGHFLQNYLHHKK